MEDEAIVARDIQVQLEALDYEHVGHAASGEDAIEMAGQLRPDLVLMDIQLAGPMDGISAATVIRERWPIPVVFLTAFAETETVSRAKLIQPFGYVVKPFSTRELRTALELALFMSQVDAKLRASESRYHAMVQSIDAGIITIDRAGRIVGWNPAAEKIFGYSADEMLARSLETLMPDTMRAQHAAGLARAVATGEHRLVGQGTAEVPGCHRDGHELWLSLQLSEWWLSDDVFFTAVIGDITETKHAQERLRLQSSALEAAANAILITDRAGTVEWANAAFFAMTGYDPHEVVGTKAGRVLRSGKHDPVFYARLWSTILAGNVWQGEIINQRKDGTLYTEAMTITPVKDDHGAITNFVAVKLDISDQKRMEDAFRHSQKMESVGRLAGGIAHDFNNMLGLILGHTEAVLQQMEPTHPIHDDLSRVFQAATRSAGLTQQLLAFASKQPANPAVIDVPTAVTGLVRLLQRMIGEHVMIDWNPQEATWPILMDSSQLDQILTNLCVNARDAIAGTGTVTVEISNCAIDAEFARRHTEATVGEYVRLVVRDTGTGIDAAVLPHIFEPFFTTKPIGEGTGLGLATVHGVVAQYHGFVLVASELGQGTSFEIYLPRYRGEVMPTGGEEASRASDVGPVRGETILVVEDEPGLLRLVSRMLSGQGYVILGASSPRAAMQLAAEEVQAIDLLLTDVIMPEMNGVELAQALRTSRPSLKWIFMSGYTADTMHQAGDAVAEGSFLQKPFLRAELLNKVRDVLDGTEA